MASPTLDQFLNEITRILREKNGTQLQNFMLLEPPLPPLYNVMVKELKKSFESSSQEALEEKCRSFLPEYDEGDEGGSWLSFISFLAKYLAFIRDVNVNDLVETHDMLKGLLKSV